MTTKASSYEAEIRANDRGGYEIAQPGEPLGVGNYATPQDAYAVACNSFERERIKPYTPPRKPRASKP